LWGWPAMARLTRKLWVGIGCVAIGGVPVAAAAQAGHGTAAPPAAAGAAQALTEGGEAYLTDGGPADTRIRFYRDIELMRGHLLIGRQLIEGNLWEEALPHFLHPTEELYGRMERHIATHNIRPFRHELLALAQAVKARRMGAYRQALSVVEERLDAALAVAKRFMHPLGPFIARTASEVLKAALSEYQTSLSGGRFANPVEYQDSRGFVWRADAMLEEGARELAGRDGAALARIRASLARLKSAWPAPTPPPAPVLQADEVAGLIADITSDAARFR
jgi:hypothetical protein